VRHRGRLRLEKCLRPDAEYFSDSILFLFRKKSSIDIGAVIHHDLGQRVFTRDTRTSYHLTALSGQARPQGVLKGRIKSQ
jgi:hypothetical protein